MVRRTAPTPTEDAPDDAPELSSSGDVQRRDGAPPDLAALPVVGITRRRMAAIIGALLACWIVIVFARQVGDASAATSRAEAMIATNEASRAEIAGLERELERIKQAPFVQQQARAHGLGDPHEVAFSLAPGASPLPADAPGSAASRVGARTSVSPLERWLTLLFGPSD